MDLLTPKQILAIWETGEQQNIFTQGFIILQIAFPDSHLHFAKLTLGERNQQLLILHEQNFGQMINCLVHCKACHQSQEFVLNTQQLLSEKKQTILHHQIVIEDYKVAFRLLTFADMVDGLALPDFSQVENFLLTRSLIEIQYQGKPFQLNELPTVVFETYIKQLHAADPLASINLNLICSGCHLEWQTYFDIGSFLWLKIKDYAKRLLIEIHQLANQYGWTEEAILKLHPRRRQFYLRACQL